MRIKIEEVFNLNNEHVIFEFCKEYALNNPEFAEMLIERFLPKKNVIVEDEFVEIDKEIEQCFMYIYDNRHDKYRSAKLDWHAIDQELYRLILRGRYMLTNGLVYEAIHLALGLLRRVGEGYGEDLVYLDQDYDGEDFSTQDAVLLLVEAMKSQCITKSDILNITEELEQISELEACSSYGLYDFSNILEKMKKINF